MALKSDRWIRRMALEHEMINPFSEKQVSKGVISFGVSSYGYDLRVADEFKALRASLLRLQDGEGKNRRCGDGQTRDAFEMQNLLSQ